jgi:hypothetical protein
MLPNPDFTYVLNTSAGFFDKAIHIVYFFIPIFLVMIGWELWIKHRNAEWLATLKWTMLEIKIPRDIYKTPFAMEVALGNALLQTGGVGTRYKRWWQGRVLVWFSLEIVSTEGDIHFYIRTPKQFVNIIQSQIYAQYPQVEIFEVEDYALKALSSMYEEEWNLYGCEQHLKKADAYPIKTYIDYGLDKPTSKPEEEAGLVDPITSVLEWMGTMKKDEHVWIQILVRASKNSFKNPHGMFGKNIDFKDKAKDVIKEIEAKYTATDAVELLGKRLKMPKSEQEAIHAIERSLDKPAFDVGIRTMYLAKKGAFRGEHITGLVGIMRPFNSNNLNGFKVAHDTSVDDDWQDPSGMKRWRKKQDMIHHYAERAWFYPPHVRPHYTLTAEELATIYHLPGRVSSTPSFKRIDSRKAEPPVNLPL